MMKKSWLGAGILAVGVGLLISQGALAGQKTTANVIITAGANEFSGSLGAARNSADTMQRIYCASDHISGICNARNAAGAVATCTTSDPDILAVIRGINGDSFLFVKHNGAGTCTNVWVNNASYYMPKNP
jgi:hypothetical protein